MKRSRTDVSVDMEGLLEAVIVKVVEFHFTMNWSLDELKCQARVFPDATLEGDVFEVKVTRDDGDNGVTVFMASGLYDLFESMPREVLHYRVGRRLAGGSGFCFPFKEGKGQCKEVLHVSLCTNDHGILVWKLLLSKVTFDPQCYFGRFMCQKAMESGRELKWEGVDQYCTARPVCSKCDPAVVVCTTHNRVTAPCPLH